MYCKLQIKIMGFYPKMGIGIMWEPQKAGKHLHQNARRGGLTSESD